MDRRNFLKTSAISISALSSLAYSENTSKTKRPNILFIMTDQQFADIMSCRMGSKYINTPAMDSLAKNGMLFTNAYTPNPLCVPARNSIFTGRYPHETTCQDNSKGKLDPAEFPNMGTYFKQAGYDTGYVGKWHKWYKTKDKKSHGFDTMAVLFNKGHDDEIPAPAIEFMNKDRDKPFLLVVSLSNPHDVCQLARFEILPSGPIPKLPPMNQRPPLRKNAAPSINESDTITLMRKSYQKASLFPVGDYDEDKWRRLIWGYYRLVEKVDALIAEVMTGLKQSGKLDNTLIVFTSDHGDCHGAHKFNQKTLFYEESARVPLILNYNNIIKQGTSDHLVNTGIDILATMLDFADVQKPKRLPGRSLKQIAIGSQSKQWRDYIVVQNHMTQGGPVEGEIPKVNGRMIRSNDFKYCIYDRGEQSEELFDIIKDRLETANLACDPNYKDTIIQHRKYLKEHADKYNDTIAIRMLEQL